MTSTKALYQKVSYRCGTDERELLAADEIELAQYDSQ
jgi:hypothetical protein